MCTICEMCSISVCHVVFPKSPVPQHYWLQKNVFRTKNTMFFDGPVCTSASASPLARGGDHAMPVWSILACAHARTMRNALGASLFRSLISHFKSHFLLCGVLTSHFTTSVNAFLFHLDVNVSSQLVIPVQGVRRHTVDGDILPQYLR